MAMIPPQPPRGHFDLAHQAATQHHSARSPWPYPLQRPVSYIGGIQPLRMTIGPLATSTPHTSPHLPSGQQPAAPRVTRCLPGTSLSRRTPFTCRWGKAARDNPGSSMPYWQRCCMWRSYCGARAVQSNLATATRRMSATPLVFSGLSTAQRRRVTSSPKSW